MENFEMSGRLWNLFTYKFKPEGRLGAFVEGLKRIPTLCLGLWKSDTIPHIGQIVSL